MFLKHIKFPVLFNHLEKTRFTYLEHIKSNVVISVYLLYGSITTMLHAVIPELFINSETNLCNTLLLLIDKRQKEIERRRFSDINGNSDV